jgi:hypothetical protein
MRLLPNLLDFSLAYMIFRPMLQINKNASLLAQLGGKGKGSEAVLGIFLSGFGELALAVLLYLVYTLIALTIGVVLNVKAKSLVLSDSRPMLWFIGLVSILISQIWFTQLPGDVRWLALLPGLYVCATAVYLVRLERIRRHPVYRVLAGVPRRSFAFATARYSFFSSEAMRVHIVLLGTFWKAYAAYFVLGSVLMSIALSARLSPMQALSNWFRGLSPVISLAFLAGLVLAAAQPLRAVQSWILNSVSDLFAQLRRRLARSASELARKDQRPPILLLRSFQDDAITVENERFWGYRFLRVRNERIRLEEVIAESLYTYGPLIALSNPLDALPPLGAAKENISDDHWKSAVESYVEHAQKIVLIAGPTPNLAWEVNLILSKEMASKCLFVFPPDYLDPENSGRLLVKVLPELARYLRLDSLESERAAMDRALVLCADSGRQHTLIRAEQRGQASAYAEALRFAFLRPGA